MSLSRRRFDVRGAVQGVGFRPFVHRLAADLQLAGWVANTPMGVAIEIEGPPRALETFRRRLEDDRPPLARIAGLESLELDPAGHVGFEIRNSLEGGPPGVHVLPDVAACELCVREVFDPRDRRYRYPFGACTHCGPRYSIVERLPYDRPNTSMQRFLLCARCRAEYEDPDDRRFHAQAVACPDCGPQTGLWAPDGRVLSRRYAALVGAAHALREGAVVAVKGVGGFHLVCNARDDAAVRRLRERKRRAEKPFAVMVGSLDEAGRQAELADAEARLLRSPEAPIVLVRRAAGSTIAASVAPGSPLLGLLLPYSPLHHLLARETAVPLVATSGNVADEALCIDEHEALGRLRGIADLLLVHDRPILRPVEDSVARVVLGRELVLRRARGYAPLPLPLPSDVPCVIAVGGPRRNASAVARGREIVLGPHVGEVGDLTRRTLDTLEALVGATPEAVACDAETADLAAERGLPVVAVGRARAHVLACMAENGLEGPVLGVAWGGTGEVVRVDGAGVTRLFTLRDFPLPGGERALREPRRAALGVLWELLGPAAFDALPFSTAEARILREALARGEARATSMERLLEAVVSLLGLRHRSGFEGQAALDLEHASGDALDGPVIGLEGGRLDWAPLIHALLAGGPVPLLAAQVHESLADVLVRIARSAGLERVALSGGCFQNRRLLERAVLRLRQAGFRPYWPQRVPPNEGGLAVGQALAAAHAGRK